MVDMRPCSLSQYPLGTISATSQHHVDHSYRRSEAYLPEKVDVPFSTHEACKPPCLEQAESPTAEDYLGNSGVSTGTRIKSIDSIVDMAELLVEEV